MEVSQNEAISEGVKVWVVAFFGDFCASRGVGSFAVRSAVDKSGNYPFFLCLYPTEATPKTALLNKE